MNAARSVSMGGILICLTLPAIFSTWSHAGQEATKTAATTAKENSIAEILKHPIIGPEVPLAEVQDFLESRIPKMPTVRSASEWQMIADDMRARLLDHVVFRGEAAAWRNAKTKVEWLETIEGGPGYRIKKLRYEALPGFWIPALLYEPEKLSGQVPVILNVNGHDRNGKAAGYKQIRCINQAKRGMLALNPDWLGMGQLSGEMSEHYRMNQLDLCGTSGLAPYYLAMQRGIDVLLSLENADPKRVAVTGLSGGGWQTIFISALDTRVGLSNPVAGYSSFFTRVRYVSDLGDSEQTPSDMATVADYAHLTAMLAPRPALLTFNAKDDCCFASDHSLKPLLEAAAPIYKLFGETNRLRFHINFDPGTHNYEKDNREQHYRMLQDFFARAKSDFGWEEIPSTNEVKTKEQLAVELPADNANFHLLAMNLMKSLPREPKLPSDITAAKRWQQNRRLALHEIVRDRNYAARAEQAGQEEINGVKATYWQVKLAGIWTVPVVELVRGEPKATTILIADRGRTNALDQVNRLLALGNRVLAMDPFYFGESKIKSRDHLFALLIAAVGERALGIQASQLTAVARWSQAEHKTGPVAVVALGPRCSLAALVASALEEQAMDGIELHGALGSLKEIIEQNWKVDEKPEMFCFGLLEGFDVKQLVALAAPTPVVFPEATNRIKEELNGVKAWYKLFGAEYQPW